jgi:hypothetical protein
MVRINGISWQIKAKSRKSSKQNAESKKLIAFAAGAALPASGFVLSTFCSKNHSNL